MNILSSVKVLTQDKTALLNVPKDVCFGKQLNDAGGSSIATAVQLGILLNEWREGKEIEMFASTLGL